MAPMSGNSEYPGIPRNVVFCGEIGTGKSSAINLLLNSGTLASVSNDSQPCTQASARYETTLNGTRYDLWDTRGLGKRSKFSIQTIFRRNSEKEFKKFLKERHHRHELDLLVYCVRGSRAPTAWVRYYNSICAITRRLFAPVVIVVTHLERERDMEDWWDRNSHHIEELKMEFDGHICITTLTGHPRTAESKKKLVDLITRNRRWEANNSGTHVDPPVQRPTSSALPCQGGTSGLFNPEGKGGVGNGRLDRHPSNYSSPSSVASSPGNSSYHRTGSSQQSGPSRSLTHHSATTSAHIYPDLLRFRDSSRPTSEETFSMRSSMRSMFYTSSHSANLEVRLQYCTEENEDHLSDPPSQLSTGTVRRTKSYPTRHGAFGDIWECELISEEFSLMVAVKAMKTNTNDGEDLRSHEKKLRRELNIWGRLQHKNVVPLLGVVPDFGPLPSMVSPWFRNGSLARYLEHHQMLNLSQKHQLLKDIAAGLCYLHRQDVIHGDLHSDNVLIDDDGTACLTDFGLSLIKDFVGTSYLKSSICGGVQFADPALVQRVNRSQDIVYPTKPSDVYSFGGLTLHVLSGKKPYEGIHPTSAIFLTVLDGKQPKVPTHYKHITLWHKSVIRKCWDHKEPKRPSADELVRMFELQ